MQYGRLARFLLEIAKIEQKSHVGPRTNPNLKIWFFIFIVPKIYPKRFGQYLKFSHYFLFSEKILTYTSPQSSKLGSLKNLEIVTPTRGLILDHFKNLEPTIQTESELNLNLTCQCSRKILLQGPITREPLVKLKYF